MAGPVHTFRRSLLPLDCVSGGGENRNGFIVSRGGGSGFPAATAAAAGGAVGMGASSGGFSGGAVAGMNAIHDSLIKVLLRVDCIQPEVGLAILLLLPLLLLHCNCDITLIPNCR